MCPLLGLNIGIFPGIYSTWLSPHPPWTLCLIQWLARGRPCGGGAPLSRLNAAGRGLAPEERVCRLDEFVGRVAKVEAKVGRSGTVALPSA